MPKVVLFSTSTCSWCRRAKRYLKEHGVPFKEINVERDQQAARDIARKTGQKGVKPGATGSMYSLKSLQNPTLSERPDKRGYRLSRSGAPGSSGSIRDE